MQFKLNSIQEVLLFLSIFSIFAIYKNPSTGVFVHLATTIGFSVILFYLFTFLSKKKKLLSNTLITSFILFLILHYFTQNQNIIYDLLVTFLAIFSKFFLEYKGSPIINPATFACLIIGYISRFFPIGSPLFVSWWGTAFGGYLSMILILPWLTYGVYRWEKLPTLISFLITNAIMLFLLQQNLELIKFIYTSSTIYFLGSIMLIDPKTSPFMRNQQIIYGLIAGITYPIFMKLNLPYFELLAIATANIYFFTKKIIQIRKQKNA